ncbi:MAG: DNA primase [Bacteroidales bacterium]|nr:DNA primase [Bacteroidales bacterium]
MIKKETAEEIKNAARIEEVVGEFVSLKRRGTNLLGLCPFHNEKTPSFTVSPAKGIYKCFGCGVSGDATRFLMDHEKYSYPEALRYLAGKYNIHIEETESTEEEKQEEKERESLIAVNNFAAKHFTERLWNSDEGKSIGLAYFRNRGFTDAIIEKFQLGYSPQKWDDLTAEALNQGYKLSYLTKAGLTISKNNRDFDRFRNRVIFPIHNMTGRVIAFGGRILSSDKKLPKYVNSPETEIYNKSKILYGIYFARNAISKEDNCLLVEGYTDVISLHQSGIENVVASSGTSLTKEQISLIKRYTSNVTILFDGDEAGLKASFRGIDMILEQGMNVKLVLFPEGEDPDSYARNHRSEEIRQFLEENAKVFIVFKTNILLKDAQDDPIKRAELIKDIVQTISKIPDQIKRSIYIRECSSIIDMQEQTLLNEMNKLLRSQYRKDLKKQEYAPEPPTKEVTTEVQQKDPEQEAIEIQEKNIIRLLLNYGHQSFVPDEENIDREDQDNHINVAEAIVNDLTDDDIQFVFPVYQKIFDIYRDFVDKEEIKNNKTLTHHEDKEIAETAINLLAEPFELSENWTKKHKIHIQKESDILEKTVVHSLLAFKLDKLKQQKHNIQESLKNMDENSDNAEVIERMKQINNLNKKVQEIADKLGRIVLR